MQTARQTLKDTSVLLTRRPLPERVPKHETPGTHPAFSCNTCRIKKLRPLPLSEEGNTAPE